MVDRLPSEPAPADRPRATPDTAARRPTKQETLQRIRLMRRELREKGRLLPKGI
jgi:hypothetical protein